MVVGAHSIPFDVAKRLKCGQQIIVAPTQADGTIVEFRLVAVVGHCQFAPLEYDLLLVGLRLVDQNLDHADPMRLI